MNSVSELKPLNEEVVAAIKDFINDKFEAEHLKSEFPNQLLREDTLALLDKYCTVIYYPLDHEENNGFHITGIPDNRGKEQHFVFINTAQTIEKQVFTAAHELGHTWKVDEIIEGRFGLAEDQREQIVNRFAAELLIPEDIFNVSFKMEYNHYKNEHGRITVANMLRVIVTLMNQFFAPEKSIILRCVELKLLGNQPADLLLGYNDIPQPVIEEKIKEIIREKGYVNFQVPNRKKWIKGMSELLEEAERRQAVPKDKIEKMRSMFNIKEDSADNGLMEETVLNG